MNTWLLTSTTYGTWLPGDGRGSVTSVRDLRPANAPTGVRVEHDRPGEPCEAPIPELAASARERMTGPPIVLGHAHAATVVGQFRETAAFRRWHLLAVAVMYNHFHLVVRAADEVRADELLRDFKSYASRALSRRFGKPASETWWTKSGSRRRLRGDQAVGDAVRYVVEKQPNPLAVWVCEGERTPTADAAGSGSDSEPAASAVGGSTPGSR